MPMQEATWEHFEHDSDVGVRGVGATVERAFEQAATALTAVLVDPARVRAERQVEIHCRGTDLELLLVDWLNAVLFEMATQELLFSRFEVSLSGEMLEASAWGEPVDESRHPLSDKKMKGATLDQLTVGKRSDGSWVAQCVVDV